MDAETLAKAAAELAAQQQRAADALKEAQAAAAAMETTRPAVWVEVDPNG